MRNKIRARHRAAALLAALAVVTMSSGIALMVAASPASAAKTPVNICHATSSDTNPYVFITVDDDSAKFKGHLMHRNDPNKHWKSAGTYEGKTHAAGDLKPDLIGDYTDDQGVFHKLDGDITAASCDDVVVENPPAVVDVDFIEPDCDNNNVADWDWTGSHIKSVEVTSGSVAPGASVTITATAADGFFFELSEGQEIPSNTMVFTHTFDDAESPCGEVSPPVTPGDVSFVDPTCDIDPAVVLPEATPVDVPERAVAGPVIETKDVDGVHYVVTGDLVPGGSVAVDATAIPPAVLADEVTTHWEHTFAKVTGCTSVSPPESTPETTTKTTPVVTPAVVHAGLQSVATKDVRGEQGLALLVGGSILLVGAGGLGLTRPRRTQQV